MSPRANGQSNVAIITDCHVERHGICLDVRPGHALSFWCCRVCACRTAFLLDGRGPSIWAQLDTISEVKLCEVKWDWSGLAMTGMASQLSELELPHTSTSPKSPTSLNRV